MFSGSGRLTLYLSALVHFLCAAWFVLMACVLLTWTGGVPSLSSVQSLLEPTSDSVIIYSFGLGLLEFICFILCLVALRLAGRITAMVLLFVVASLYVFLGTLSLLRPRWPDAFMFDLWDGMGKQARGQCQDLLKCCGLRDPSDRVVDSAYCPVTITPAFADNTTSIGCIQKLDLLTGDGNRNLAYFCFSAALFSYLCFMLLIATKDDSNIPDDIERQKVTSPSAPSRSLISSSYSSQSLYPQVSDQDPSVTVDMIPTNPYNFDNTAIHRLEPPSYRTDNHQIYPQLSKF